MFFSAKLKVFDTGQGVYPDLDVIIVNKLNMSHQCCTVVDKQSHKMQGSIH